VQTVTSEIAGRTQPTLFDLLVALLSAIAGGYALIRGRGGTVVGVAIAIALMPPLVVVGFGIATWNWTIFWGALLLFLTNAVTIALTAALVARLYGFGSHLSPSHTGWQLILFVAAVGLLSIPLGAALKRIAFEAVAQRQAREILQQRFPDGARLSLMDIDQSARPMRIRAVMLTPKIAAGADRTVAQDLARSFGRPVDLHIDQIRISPEPGAAEAAQLAHVGDARKLSPAEQNDRAVADLALVAGIPVEAVQLDPAAHLLGATAAPMPGLTLAGYRLLEARAARALPDWTVRLAPPAEVELPDLAIDHGVIDPSALDLAAWASARRAQDVEINGGTAAQRTAIGAAIQARGGHAAAGSEAGRLRIRWPSRPPQDQR
jgi:hypothetical protein